MPPTLTAEQRQFLLEGTRTGKLATTRKDGRPHVVPIWFDLDGDTLVFTTAETSLKGKSLRRDPRVCMCVDDEQAPFAFLMIEGSASISEDPEELLRWATRLGGRYMGAGRAEEYGARNGVAGELLVRVTPTNIVFKKNVAGYE